jgi:pimeloyl-ACP methyl ester carboxylesterase
MPFVENQGVKIYYETIGKGTPIVMLHGILSDITSYEGYLESFKENYKLVLINLRGHGRSDKPHNIEDYFVEKLAADVLVVLDNLDIDKTHFWGYSMGGLIGFYLATYHPERFISFIFGGISPQPFDEEVMKRGQVLIDLVKGGAEGYLAALKQGGNELSEEYETKIRNCDFTALAAFASSDFPVKDNRYMGEISVPILIYTGEEDVYRHHQRSSEYAKSRTNVTYVSFPNRGHEVQGHCDLIIPHVKEFLENLTQWDKQKN